MSLRVLNLTVSLLIHSSNLSCIPLFVDNIDQFLNDLQTGFSFLSRIRGKKQDSNLAHNEIIAKYERLVSLNNEQEVKKRKRDKLGNEEENPKNSKVENLFPAKQKV